jgi:glutathione S-transferase
MALKLFYTSISPPARAVLLTIRNLDLQVEINNVNLLSGENLTPEFMKINPIHQVPVLIDDNFVLSESRAIMAYLVNSKRPGSDLYPSDAKSRAVVDQRLYYDATVVFERNGAAIVRKKSSM